ncbi:MAG: LURP-one-related family protein [Oscillospiraceae bacterium]|nr:LURP-one-related family protein [Oscillospiraceae bacterium]
MRLTFKERLFTWFDSYDIYDEDGNVMFEVKGELSWGHLLRVYDSHGREVGCVQEKILSFLPKFEIFRGNDYAGCIKKEFTFFRPSFDIDYRGWYVQGDFFEWDYTILNSANKKVATVYKELLHLTDTYIIDVRDSRDVLDVLMLVLAIDAEKCSRKN